MSQPKSHTLSGGDAADLAQFGYAQSMERHTGKFASFAVAFAFVSIATGIFTTYGAVLNSSGPVGIWTWPIAVVGQLAVAFVLYARRAFGRAIADFDQFIGFVPSVQPIAHIAAFRQSW